eukprot:TRINITY_DN14630_c0_g2_i1.p1 TRINITY_DN14630_c0_g2~~TRINITY_DN14630_c0_g2_i1.p1  ORF type:complete len:1471 (-),score=295.66 TRINITY_DN14630_c0_g2_i1:78-4490(-)
MEEGEGFGAGPSKDDNEVNVEKTYASILEHKASRLAREALSERRRAQLTRHFLRERDSSEKEKLQRLESESRRRYVEGQEKMKAEESGQALAKAKAREEMGQIRRMIADIEDSRLQEQARLDAEEQDRERWAGARQCYEHMQAVERQNKREELRRQKIAQTEERMKKREEAHKEFCKEKEEAALQALAKVQADEERVRERRKKNFEGRVEISSRRRPALSLRVTPHTRSRASSTFICNEHGTSESAALRKTGVASASRVSEPDYAAQSKLPEGGQVQMSSFSGGASRAMAQCASPPPRQWIVFSSSSALLGLARGSDYAISNAYLSAATAWAHGQDLAVKDTTWGGIALGLGAAALSSTTSISGDLYSHLFALAVRAPSLSIDGGSGLALFDVPAIRFMPRALGVHMPMLRTLAQRGEVRGGISDLAHDGASAVAARSAALVSGDGEARQSFTEDSVRSIILKCVGHLTSGDFDAEVDAPLMDSGLDSLSAVALRNILMQEFKLPTLGATIFFDYPGIRQLSQYIFGILQSEHDGQVVVRSGPSLADDAVVDHKKAPVQRIVARLHALPARAHVRTTPRPRRDGLNRLRQSVDRKRTCRLLVASHANACGRNKPYQIAAHCVADVSLRGRSERKAGTLAPAHASVSTALTSRRTIQFRHTQLLSLSPAKSCVRLGSDLLLGLVNTTACVQAIGPIQIRRSVAEVMNQKAIAHHHATHRETRFVCKAISLLVHARAMGSVLSGICVVRATKRNATALHPAICAAPPEVPHPSADIKSFSEDQVESVIRALLASIGVETDVEIDAPLMDAGIDSLSAVALRNELMQEFNLKSLPATLLIDYPAIRQLKQFILSLTSKEFGGHEGAQIEASAEVVTPDERRGKPVKASVRQLRAVQARSSLKLEVPQASKSRLRLFTGRKVSCCSLPLASFGRASVHRRADIMPSRDRYHVSRRMPVSAAKSLLSVNTDPSSPLVVSRSTPLRHVQLFEASKSKSYGRLFIDILIGPIMASNSSAALKSIALMPLYLATSELKKLDVRGVRQLSVAISRIMRIRAAGALVGQMQWLPNTRHAPIAMSASATSVTHEKDAQLGSVPSKKTFTESQVRSVVQSIVESITTDDITDLDTPLINAGIDSLSEVGLRNALMHEFELPSLPATLLLDYPGLQQLSNYIFDVVGGAAATAGSGAELELAGDDVAAARAAREEARSDVMVVDMTIDDGRSLRATIQSRLPGAIVVSRRQGAPLHQRRRLKASSRSSAMLLPRSSVAAAATSGCTWCPPGLRRELASGAAETASLPPCLRHAVAFQPTHCGRIRDILDSARRLKASRGDAGEAAPPTTAGANAAAAALPAVPSLRSASAGGGISAPGVLRIHARGSGLRLIRGPLLSLPQTLQQQRPTAAAGASAASVGAGAIGSFAASSANNAAGSAGASAGASAAGAAGAAGAGSGSSSAAVSAALREARGLVLRFGSGS